MAEETFRDDFEKTEEPTPKRREDARRKGQFAKSRTLAPAAMLLALTVALRFGGEQLMVRMERCMVGFFSAAGRLKHLGSEEIVELSRQAGLLFAPVLLLLLGAGVLAGLGAGFLQSGFALASEPLRFDLGRIDPFKGFRRLVSLETAAESLKALIFIAGLGTVGGALLYSDMPALITLSAFAAEDILSYARHEAAVLMTWVVGTLGALAALDYAYQRWRTNVQLRMSRQELKEEMREQDGSPEVKSRLKSLRQKLARRRMTADVAKADVVITNPTEIAVALRYRAGEMSAPRVVGKGAGYIAQTIRQIARDHGIPIVENRPLARLLYRQCEVGREIPEALYRAVAEVLAYVYRLRHGSRGAAAKAGAPHV